MSPRYIKIVCVIAMKLLVASCSSNQAPVEHKENLYYSKSGVFKFVRVTKSQDLESLAITYNVPIELLASINNMDIDDVVKKGKMVKIPVSKVTIDSKIATIKDLGEINDEDLEEAPLQDDIDETQADVLQNKVIDKNNINQKTISKSDFYTKTPLNSKQFIWPIDGKVISHYGKSASGFSEGISISAPLGTVIKSAADGEVLYAGNEPKVYGNLIIIKHKNNYLTAYSYLDKLTIKKGDKVSLGQAIGTVGQTGKVTKPTLLFTIRHNKKTIDPEGSSASSYN